MNIDVNLVRELREITGAGMLDCKKALEKTSNDFPSALELIKEKIESDRKSICILDYNRNTNS